ncbi:hypothetical protein HPB49_012127 [Dermacentor silvarum]|uniref:Uncharacterized protein n=1 Tax=Dermacentor silvarum TaxID=543639 RepID=A0ACB8DCL3_DERSI|nr:hypothetical protein HPB49_012127 [Dermacentor silvarum]
MRFSVTVAFLAAALCSCLLVGGTSPALTRRQQNQPSHDTLWQSLTRYSPIALALSLMALPLLPLVFTGPATLAGTGHAINALNLNPGMLMKRSAESSQLSPSKSAAASHPASSLFSSAPAMVALMTRFDEVLQKYDVTEPDCRLRLACELHRDGLSPQAATIADRLVRLFGVEQRIERSSFGPGTKTMVRELLKAARHGLGRKDCAHIYSRCPYAPRDMLKSRVQG